MMKIKLSFAVSVLGLFVLWFLCTGCDRQENHTEPSLKGIEMPKHLNSDGAEVIVRGKINKVNPAFFDLDTLMKFPCVSFEEKNAWKNEVQSYVGASLWQVLRFLEPDPSATLIDVIAANDYKASIRIADIRKYEYILSYKLNGKLYKQHEPARDKGPVAIAINFGKHPELPREIYKHQLVWYVRTIIVK
ncbi:hypothetical protein QUF72_02130 [Desulfobacterales bacterium HSG2]|nr:hypothetical protein [Desulfobacterales bacterium HSG2]